MILSTYLRKLGGALLAFIAPGVEFSSENNYAPINDDEKKKKLVSWSDGFKNLFKLLPLLWPKTNAKVRNRIIVCMSLVVVERFIYIMIPIYNQKIVDSVGNKVFCWDLIVIYCGLKFLQGSGAGSVGFLRNFRAAIWNHVAEFMVCELQVVLFAHLHNLSLRWHLKRKTGEVLQVMDRATESIKDLVDNLLFMVVPTVFDVIVSLVFLSVSFSWYLAIIVIVTMFLYIRMTVLIENWGKQYRRNKNSAYDEQKNCSVDSLMNFETVKYYGAEKYEVETYRKAINGYQKEASKSSMLFYLINVTQDLIICFSLLVGSIVCAFLVVDVGSITPGQYVLFASYIIQLYMPFDWLAYSYRYWQRCFVDMENMFDILNEEPDIVDSPDAIELPTIRGDVSFSNVTFGYSPERVILKDVSFSVKAGKTVALVGPTGSGKSTIIRLLFRFYDIEFGSICIDGKNIKHVKQDSLRAAIGVVPQDTVLFNNSISYNIKYGRLNATDAELDSAVRSSDIHQHIMQFPEKFETKVGERGLRLSGGEKQRVAIARTILKAPSIVLLDEATSALDTKTERNIQAALSRVCSNRTTIIVAHRLSTVIHADEILVLKDGEIVERGRHDDLLKKDGMYASMWHQQFENEEMDQSNDDSENDEKQQKNIIHRRTRFNSQKDDS